MAVPKKKTSKMKARQRFANWQAKIKTSMTNALSTAKMLLSQRSKYKQKIDNENEDNEDNEII
jgi:ribosomal protein L32